MQNTVFEALATSTAHGISRAAAAKSIPIRITWILLFLVFLGMFCNNGITLVNKLVHNNIVTIREDEKVAFKFPDLYFCPSNAISGSYPFFLNDSEAEIVNNEIVRLGQLYDDIVSAADYVCTSSLKTKAKMIFRSMTRQTMRLLFKRPEQALLTYTKSSAAVRIATVLIEENRLCFKYSLSDMRKQHFEEDLNLKLPFEYFFKIALFTDPYNSHFNHSGTAIKPIEHKWTNESAAPYRWDFENGIQDRLTDSGYTLILVEDDKMPSVFESKLQLSPGRAYFISLGMEEVAFSSELHHQRCSPNGSKLVFVDSLSGNPLEYNYSHIGCVHSNHMSLLYQNKKYVSSKFPVPWELRDSPRLLNLSEHSVINASNSTLWRRWNSDGLYDLNDDAEFCDSLRPCTHRKYNVERYSFRKWPMFSGRYHKAIQELMGKGYKPALEQVLKMAELLDIGNHTAHTEALFRRFLSDSMLMVHINVESPKVPKLTISRSYSVTAFLADIGGLLGLYMGCSLLTFFELFELFYHVGVSILLWRRHPKHPKGEEMTLQTATPSRRLLHRHAFLNELSVSP